MPRCGSGASPVFFGTGFSAVPGGAFLGSIDGFGLVIGQLYFLLFAGSQEGLVLVRLDPSCASPAPCAAGGVLPWASWPSLGERLTWRCPCVPPRRWLTYIHTMGIWSFYFFATSDKIISNKIDCKDGIGGSGWEGGEDYYITATVHGSC